MAVLVPDQLMQGNLDADQLGCTWPSTRACLQMASSCLEASLYFDYKLTMLVVHFLTH